MSTRQDQKKKILGMLDSIWRGFNIGNMHLVEFLSNISESNSVPLDELTDDMIQAWLEKETDYIYRVCTGSVLNG